MDSHGRAGPEEPEPSFQDPHVPFDTHTESRGAKMEAMELQDLEFEPAEGSCGRRARWGELSPYLLH